MPRWEQTTNDEGGEQHELWGQRRLGTVHVLDGATLAKLTVVLDPDRVEDAKRLVERLYAVSQAREGS